MQENVNTYVENNKHLRRKIIYTNVEKYKHLCRNI